MTTSWDDGHPLDIKVAELLVKYGLQGTFYIPKEGERTVLTPTQIRQISAAFEVGAHTVHHVDLTRVPDALAKTEISESKELLEYVTGKPCSMFCFPKGRYRREHLRFVRDAGYAAVRTVELMSVEFPRHEVGVLVMPTTVQAFSHSVFAYLKNGAKRLRCSNLLNYVLHCRSSDWVAVATALLSLVERRGGVFHLWGHSWEIDEMGCWRQLEDVLRIMSDWGGQAHLTNSQVCTYLGDRLPVSPFI